MTFGQLSIWRSMQALPVPRRVEGNVPRTWPVPPETTPAQVAVAWRVLVTRHEALRTLFGPDGSGGLRQRVGAADPGWVPAVVGLASGEPAAAAADLAKAPMDLSTEYGWRVGLTDRAAGGVRHVLVVAHHIVVDGWSFDQLHAEFLAALAGDPRTETGLRPVVLARQQWAEAAAGRRRAAVDYVSECLTAAPSRASSVIAPDSGRRSQIELVTPGGHRALIAVARRTGIFAQSVLLALTAICLHRVWDGTQAKVMLVSGNRADRRWHTLVTSMGQPVPVPIGRLAEDQTFTELARTMQGASLRAFRYGSYDTDGVVAAVPRAETHLFDSGSVFNYIAPDLPAAPADGVARELRRQQPNRHTGPRFDLKIYGSPALKINLRADPALLAEDQVNALLGWYERELVRIAADPDELIGDLARRCLSDQPAGSALPMTIRTDL